MRQPANHEPNEKMAIFAPWKISFSTWAEYFLPATEVSVRKNSTTFSVSSVRSWIYPEASGLETHRNEWYTCLIFITKLYGQEDRIYEW